MHLLSRGAAIALTALAFTLSFAQTDPAAAQDASCKQLFKIRSLNSNTKTKITFINNSGMHRGIMWLDFKGQAKDYASLNHGQRVNLNTFLTHPWMITTGPGDCLEIIQPRAGGSVVTLKPRADRR